MAMAATRAGWAQIQMIRCCVSSSSGFYRRPSVCGSGSGSGKLFCFHKMSFGRSLVVVGASESQKEVNAESNDPNPSSKYISQDDLNFLVKLGAGSVVGAAVIKYGSVLFPEITRPDLWKALIMICAPVIIAVLLLIKQSLVERGS